MFILLLLVVGVHHVVANVDHVVVGFHCVHFFFSCTAIDVHRVVVDAHHVVLMFIMLFAPLWLVLPLPLHYFASWSFIGGGRLVVAKFQQKLLHFKYFHFFHKLVCFLFILFLSSYIENNVPIICLDLFVQE